MKGKPRKLKPEEVNLFKTHSKHHSKKHIDFMKRYIRSDKGCFSMAHREEIKKTGK